MSLSFAAIIPIYNEEERLKKVLAEVQKIRELSQVVCVNDGSTDHSSQILKQNFPQFRLVNCRKNRGKAAAIARGLAYVKEDYVLLLDADLQNLQASQIRRAVRLVKQTQLDMLILRRVSSILLTKLICGDLLLTGERILKKAVLAAALKLPVSGFQIEMAINHYCLTAAKKIAWFAYDARSTFKVQKRGFFSGLLMELQMTSSLLRYRGVGYYFWQLFRFLKIPRVV